MKKSIIYSAIGVVLGTMIFMGCVEEKKYPDLVLGNSSAPTATLSHVADSLNETYTYITASSNMDGEIFYVVLLGGSDAPTADDIILGNVEALLSGVLQAEASVSYDVKLKDLTPGVDYDVYAVSTNSDEGKASPLVGPVSFSTPDDTPPTLEEMIPANGETWVSVTISEIVLMFDEAVTLVDADMVSIVDAFDESDLGVKGDITVAGSVVAIALTDTLPYITDVAVILDEGAFVDASGNESMEYYADVDGYLLTFQTEDIINMENFLGPYACDDIDIAYADEYFYDVFIVQSGPYSVDIFNFANWDITFYATLDFDPVAHTCALPDQFSGLAAGGDPLNFTSEELLEGYVSYTPGSYTDDGVTIKFSMWLYSPAFGDIYWIDDMELTKYVTPGSAPALKNDPNRVLRELKPIARF